MTELEKNNVQKLHELLDIALLCNGMEKRQRSYTGMMPTMFLRFSGHVAAVTVDLYKNGWNDEGEIQTDHEEWWIDFDRPIPGNVVESIRAAADSALSSAMPTEEQLAVSIAEAEEELKQKKAEITAMKRNLKAMQMKGA